MQIGKRTLLAKTCLWCGIFKQAKDFAVMRKGYRASLCYSCKNAASRPVVYKHQEKALGAAVRNREPWTDRDIDRLLEMSQKGFTGPQMALALNRTVYSVYTMKHKLKGT